ncbi:hypothetical protein BH11ARM2_BH11ARM2_38880 [soil metagenome]
MERRLVLLALIAFLVIGCGSKEPMSTDVKAPDPYAGMTKEQKIKAIQDDPKINGMQKQSMIDEANKGG